MATFTDFDALTSEHQARCSEYVPQARALAGELHQLLDKIAALDALWNNDISAIMTALPNGAGVRNPSGLSEAAEMTDLDHVTLHSYYQGIQTSYGTAAHRANLVQAAGVVAVL